MVQWSLFSVAAVLAALALFVFKARPQHPLNRWFACTTIVVALWTFGIGGMQNATNTHAWLRAAFAAASLIPVTFLNLVRWYPVRSLWPSNGVMVAMFVVGIMFAIFSATTSFVFYEPEMLNRSLVRKSGPLYLLFAGYFVGVWTVALALLIHKWWRAQGIQRAQLTYFSAGVILSGAGGITTNLLLPLLTGRSTYNWLGPHFALVFVVLIAHSIIRYRILDLRLVFHRGLVYFAAILFSLSPAALLAVVFWPRLSTQLSDDELATLLTAIAIVSLIAPIIRDVTSKLLDSYVYRTRTNYQQTVRDASQLLTRVLDLRTLLTSLCRSVVSATGTEGIAVYMNRNDKFSIIVAESQTLSGAFEVPEHIPQPVLDEFARTGAPVTVDQFSKRTPSPDRAAAIADLERLNWALVLPLVSDDMVIGVIAIGPKLSGDPFYPQDLDLLTTLANQAGIAIKNAQLYAEVVLANEYIENIVATINSGVVAIDAEGRITMFNRAAEQLTGLARSSVHLQPVAGLPACLSAALGQTVIDGRQLTQPEIALPDGTDTRPVMCTTSALRDTAGSILGAVAVFSDLTPLKELESERRRVEKAAYLEVVASGLAHEIKNPLVSIKAFAQLLPRRHDDPQFRDNFIRIVPREVARVEGLLERLGTLARPSDRPQHPLDVRAPIREALEFVQPDFDEKRVSLTSRLPQGEAIVLGNHDEVKQLVYNLLMNAHEATPPGGAVTLELAACGEQATALVTDTGPGIPAELLDRIFDAFITTRKRGSGLGLAICAHIARAHRARLRAANGTSGGAVFTVEFPLLTGVPTPVSA